MSRKKSSAKKRRRVQRRSLWLLAVAAVLLAFGLGLWWGGGTPSRPPHKTVSAPAKPAPQPKPKPKAKAKPKAPAAVSQAKPQSQRPSLPRVALIIDDMGYGLEPLERLLALRVPLTVSVLPHAPQAKAVASRARAAGLGVMLHLPMEPVGSPEQPPGQGMLRVGMGTPEILAVLKMDLTRVPQAQGVNNHMGSLYSRSAARLEPVLRELKKRGLFYVDSFTAADSQGLNTARRLGLATARRDVFLDHSPKQADIDVQMERLLRLSRERGAAIAIGHPLPSTLKALERWAPRLQKQAHLVLVKELVKKDG